MKVLLALGVSMALFSTASSAAEYICGVFQKIGDAPFEEVGIFTSDPRDSQGYGVHIGDNLYGLCNGQHVENLNEYWLVCGFGTVSEDKAEALRLDFFDPKSTYIHAMGAADEGAESIAAQYNPTGKRYIVQCEKK